MGVVDEVVDAIAAHRDKMHEGHPNSRQMAGDVQRIGLKGEFEFGKFCGQMPDLSDRPDGDGGTDFVIPFRMTVDVKTARSPRELLHIVGKGVADIFVLAHFDEYNNETRLIGWCFASTVTSAPTRPGKPTPGRPTVTNYVVPAAKLRPMRTLAERIGRITYEGVR